MNIIFLLMTFVKPSGMLVKEVIIREPCPLNLTQAVNIADYTRPIYGLLFFNLLLV